MNYPSLPGNHQPKHRPPRKSNFMLLLILGFMAFFLYSQYMKPHPASDMTGEERAEGRVKGPIGPVIIPDISNDGPQSPEDGIANTPRNMDGVPIGVEPANNGDWEIDTDVELDEPTLSVVGSQKGIDSNTSGDWTLEVGSSTPVASKPNAGRTAKSKPKSTTRGDWELSEVEEK